jgi:hypothetical protein
LKLGCRKPTILWVRAEISGKDVNDETFRQDLEMELTDVGGEIEIAAPQALVPLPSAE